MGLARTKVLSVAGTVPVTVAQLKSELKLDGSAEDTRLGELIDSAVAMAEEITRRAIRQQTVRLMLDAIPGGGGPWWNGVREGPLSMVQGPAKQIELPRPPLISVTHVKTYDDTDTATTMAAAGYFVDDSDASQPGRIVLRTAAVWPVALRTANAVEVEYVAGWANGLVPASLRAGILRMAAHLYAHPGDCAEECAQACGAMTYLGRWIVRSL